MTETTMDVRPAGIKDMDRVVGPIVLGFARDPLIRFFYPDPHTFLAAFPQMVAAVAKPAFESGTAHRVSDFAGSALWLPPDAHPDSPAIRAIFEKYVDADRLTTIFSVIEEKNKYHPEEPHWYLHMIGVDPRLQGGGYGSLLMRHALDLIDSAHLAAYLESSNPANLTLYQRHGFEVITVVEVEGAPPVFPMLRPAR